MAVSDSTPPPLSSKKENVAPIGSRLTELSESRVELMTRIQGLKQDLQSWRSKLDTQVKVYRDELSDLKKSLNIEVEHLRSDFQELRTTLQQQQEDVTAKLRKLGLQDVSANGEETQGGEARGNDSEAHVLPSEGNDMEQPNDDAETNAKEAQVSPTDNVASVRSV